MRNPRLKPLFSAARIAMRIREMGAAINADYAGKTLALICVLKGAFMFFSDLSKCLNCAPEMDFVRVSSYRGGMVSSGLISFTKDIEINIVDRHVLLVEDIVDSGRTVSFLRRQFLARGAASLKIAALLVRSPYHELAGAIDYSGFEVRDGFIVGYGLDYAEKYRELPEICVLETERD